MSNANFILLYVDNPEASSNFYSDLLQRRPVEASSTFVLFALDSGLMLGLWSRHAVQPGATALGGGAELAFPVESDAAVNATFADWKGRGLTILQEPTVMDFGRTFVALDPDNHRLRVFASSAE